MPKIMFKSGGPHMDATGKTPLMWELSKQPGLSEAIYLFVPGVPVQVTDDDALWLLEPQNTRGRVFELVDEAPAPARASIPAAAVAAKTAGSQAQAATTTPTPPDQTQPPIGEVREHDVPSDAGPSKPADPGPDQGAKASQGQQGQSTTHKGGAAGGGR